MEGALVSEVQFKNIEVYALFALPVAGISGAVVSEVQPAYIALHILLSTVSKVKADTVDVSEVQPEYISL